MGYDMNLVVLKNKTLNNIREKFPDYTFSEMYSSFLVDYLYPDEYIIPKDEVGREIVWANRDIFCNFFEGKLNNDEAIIVDEDTYTNMFNWLENEMKVMTLYDVALSETDADFYSRLSEIEEMMRAYRQMRKEKIDFESEFVVYHHDW